MATPEISLAVGSVHVTIKPEVPSSTTFGIVAGQFMMVGGVVSSVKSPKENMKNGC